jgi:CMP-N,N'-diacetyllegionaminic acid synthase
VKKVICLIPVRSKSKRIKNKNITKIKKVPLIKFVLNNIIKCKEIDDFIVASDKIEIFNQININSDKINFFKRSNNCSKDTSSTESVINEFLRKYPNQFDVMILLQITNPFINSELLGKAIKFFKKKNFDSLFSSVKTKHFLWRKKTNLVPLNYDYRRRKRSQKISGDYIENGSFYIFYKKKYLKFKNRLHGRIGTFEMKKESIFEIDTIEDLKIIKKLI